MASPLSGRTVKLAGKMWQEGGDSVPLGSGSPRPDSARPGLPEVRGRSDGGEGRGAKHWAGPCLLLPTKSKRSHTENERFMAACWNQSKAVQELDVRCTGSTATTRTHFTGTPPTHAVPTYPPCTAPYRQVTLPSSVQGEAAREAAATTRCGTVAEPSRARTLLLLFKTTQSRVTSANFPPDPHPRRTRRTGGRASWHPVVSLCPKFERCCLSRFNFTQKTISIYNFFY